MKITVYNFAVLRVIRLDNVDPFNYVDYCSLCLHLRKKGLFFKEMAFSHKTGERLFFDTTSQR